MGATSPVRLARTSWRIDGKTIAASSNEPACLAILDEALPLARAPRDEPPDCLRVEIHVEPEWSPPIWLPQAATLWSNGGPYRMCRVAEDPAVVYDRLGWARFHSRERRIEIGGPPRLAEDAFVLSQAIFATLLPAALRSWGWLPLHAAAVDWGGRAVVFPAATGSGKSTLALALVRAGFRLLADDMPILRPTADGAFTLRGFPERCRVLPGTLAFFPELRNATLGPSGPKLLVDPSAVYPGCFVDESLR